MFYSHEVLTNTKYGVATVWLVATLGGSSTRKKPSRTEILGVNVPKACKTITNSDTPLALRLQSNLLYGVSSVYSQQCTYVLNDAEHVRMQVRNAMRVLRSATITTTNGHVAKRDQITLQETSLRSLGPELYNLPGLPELDFELSQPVGVIGIDSQTFSLDSHTSQLSSEGSLEPPTEQLIIPSERDSIEGYNALIPSLRQASSYSGSPPADSIRIGSHLFDADPPQSGLLDDIGLTIDADGNIFEGPMPGEEDILHVGGSQTGHVLAKIGEQIGPLPMYDDFQLPELPEDLELLHNARPFSPRNIDPVETTETEQRAGRIEASSHAQRGRKVLGLDTVMEMSNADFTAMDRLYGENMQRAATVRFNRRVATLAPYNANSWVMGSHMDHGPTMTGTELPMELQMFSGGNILASLGIFPGAAARTSSKRLSESGDDEGRRVRPRLEGSEVGRADEERFEGLNDLLMDDDYTLEMGRDAGTPLANIRSSNINMPWNIRSSTRGSSVPRPLILGSAGGFGSSVSGGPGSIGVRGSSVNMSPLAQLPRALNVPADVTAQEAADEIAQDAGSGVDAQPGDDMQHKHQNGSDQTEQPSWMSQNSDPESNNFFTFIAEAIEEKRMNIAAQGTEDSDDISIDFEELFPPGTHSTIVATHALMHVLTLGGKGVLRVAQEQLGPFQSIALRVI